jgi:biopolymer transport protein ExbD
MKNKLLLSIIALLFANLSIAQEERPEVLLINCLYESYDDGGKAFKELLNAFEVQLIKEKILKDETGESYIQFLKVASKGNLKNLIIPSNFVEDISEIKKPDSEKTKLCREQMDEKYNIESTKIGELNVLMKDIMSSDNIELSSYANGILSILRAEDFEIDFYKLNIFYFFSIINTSIDSGLARKLPKEKEIKDLEVNLENALHVDIDENNEVFLYNKKITLIDLEKEVKSYELKYKSKALIILKNNKLTHYNDYIKVQNVIISAVNSVRDILAKEIYGKVYKELEKNEAEVIKKQYPLNLRELEDTTN